MKDFKNYIFLGINSYILYGTILVLFSLSRIFNILSAREIFIISVICSYLVKFLLYKKEGREFSIKTVIFMEAAYLALFVIIVAGASFFYDTTYDGRAYHQEGIILLADGYNPVYEQLDENKVLHALWINHYPKAAEIVSAALYSFTGNIETGKAFHILFIFSNILMGTGLFLRWGKLSYKTGAVFSLIMGLNPVAVCQSLTYYVDGQQWSLLLAASYLMMLYILEKKQTWNMMLAWVVISLVNIKFTALVYAVMTAGVYGFFLLLTATKKEFRKSLAITGISFVIAVFCVGFNPYVTNTLIKGHPFYPIYGENKVDIITGNAPDEFKGKNRFEKFYLSFLGRTGNVMSWWSDEKIVLKIPFTFDREEIKALSGCDIRVAGFGPFFSGICLVSAFIYFLHKLGRFKKQAGTGGYRRIIGSVNLIDVLLFCVAASVVINPEPWWARYVPQVWVIPVLMTLSVMITDNKKKGLTLVPVSLFVVSILLTVWIYIGSNMADTSALNHELALLSEIKGTIEVYFENFRSDRLKLIKKGIAYREVTGGPKPTGEYENTLLGHGTLWHNDKFLHAVLKRKN
ncbi:MAG: hypothetical protein WC836_20430 [Desulfobacula sp.]